MRDANRRPAKGAAEGPRQIPSPSPMDSVQVLCGSMLCRLHIWDEAAWAELPAAERPAQSTYFPGLGWVGAVPILCLN